ncbi:MAG: arsenate reductase ArsC [Nitrospiraceae bacterium]
MKRRVLFLCTGNSARSQMAEGLLRHMAGDAFDVASAGTQPTVLNPLAIEAMREIGIDISDNKSKHIDGFINQHFDFVITVCDRAKETCPVFPSAASTLHWSFDDPAAVAGAFEERREIFRRVRKEIVNRVHVFIKHEARTDIRDSEL